MLNMFWPHLLISGWVSRLAMILLPKPLAISLRRLAVSRKTARRVVTWKTGAKLFKLKQRDTCLPVQASILSKISDLLLIAVLEERPIKLYRNKRLMELDQYAPKSIDPPQHSRFSGIEISSVALNLLIKGMLQLLQRHISFRHNEATDSSME
jgi:hypothetical protein